MLNLLDFNMVSCFSQQPVVSQLEPVIWDEDNEISMLVAGEIPHVNVCRFIAIRFVETTAMEKVSEVFLKDG